MPSRSSTISNIFRRTSTAQTRIEAVASVLWRMPSGHYNTDLGWSLNDFNKEYLDTLNGQTTLIIVGDGRNNYNDPRLDIFTLMTRRAARTIWLNPEPPVMWHGDSDMPKYAPLLQQCVEGWKFERTCQRGRSVAFCLTTLSMLLVRRVAAQPALFFDSVALAKIRLARVCTVVARKQLVPSTYNDIIYS